MTTERLMNTKDILIKARKLIEKRERWCKGEFFKGDAQCMAGAIARAMDVDPGKAICSPAYDALTKVTGTFVLAVWNDSHTHAEVLAVFDRAIEAA